MVVNKETECIITRNVNVQNTNVWFNKGDIVTKKYEICNGRYGIIEYDYCCYVLPIDCLKEIMLGEEKQVSTERL